MADDHASSLATGSETPCAYQELVMPAAGFYVYRIWAGRTCLYVGMVGSRGPRPMWIRIREHMVLRPWWPEVTYVDFTKCTDRAHAFREERAQIDSLNPLHNKPAGTQMAPARRRREIAPPEHAHWAWSAKRAGGWLCIDGGEPIYLPKHPTDSPQFWAAIDEYICALGNPEAIDAVVKKIEDICA